MRQEFLLSNFLAFYEELGQRVGTEEFGTSRFYEKLGKELNYEILTILPSIIKTGIEEIDEKNNRNP